MGAPATDSSDADALVGPAVALVRSWARTSERSLSRAERRERERFADLTGDPGSVAFTMSFADRVLRPRSDDVAARQLRRVVRGASPAFLSPLDRGLLRSGARLSRRLPGTVMSLARRRLRQIVGDLVVDRADPTLARHLSRSADEGFGVNVNLLGESVLGEREARRRLAATIDLLERPDVSYVSVKASAVTSQLNLWAYEDSLARVTNGLRPILQAAAGHTPAKFVNLDMEEYKDLRLTVDAFTALLDEPGLHSIEAGIVLQAYLPDSFDALVHLVGWATERRRRGGAGIKVRVVKGANLAMEKVDAAMHGWTQAPFDTKASTDANYKRMLDWAMQPDRVAAARIGVASHNLFDVAWAKLLADVRGVTDRVEFEMLQGMAPGEARTVRDATGALLLYTPVVAADDFDTALAYLFRRLEENSSGDNFLRHAFDLAGDAAAFAGEQARFELAVADRWAVSSAPRRRNAPPGRGSTGFANQPDTDPLDDGERSRIIAALASPPMPDLPAEVTAAGVDEIVARAAAPAAGGPWIRPSGAECS